MHQAERERKDTLDQVHELDYYLVNEYQKSVPAESYAKLLFQQLLDSSKKAGTISPVNFDSKAYHSSEIYRAKEQRFISKEEFEHINHKLAYKAQIIDEQGEYGGDYYIFENGLIVRKFTAEVNGKFVYRYEIVKKIPEKDRTGGVKELDSLYEGTPLELLEYIVDPKDLAIKGGKKLFGKGLKELGERLAIKVEKTGLTTAGAYNGYVEPNLHIKKSVDSVKIEKEAVDDRKLIMNQQLQEGETVQILGSNSKGTGNREAEVPPAFRQTDFASSYEERYNQTPSPVNSKVEFEGIRGESLSTLKPPPDPKLKRILDEAGIKGIQYKNGVPDFSPVSKAQIEIDYMLGGKGN